MDSSVWEDEDEPSNPSESDESEGSERGASEEYDEEEEGGAALGVSSVEAEQEIEGDFE